MVWHGPECKATRVGLNPDVRKAEKLLRELKEMISTKYTAEIAPEQTTARFASSASDVMTKLD